MRTELSRLQSGNEDGAGGDRGAPLPSSLSRISGWGRVLPCTRLLQGSRPAWGPGGRKEALATLHPRDSRLFLGWTFVRLGRGLVGDVGGTRPGLAGAVG